MKLYVAQLLSSNGDKDKALEELKTLTNHESDIGYQSALMATHLYIEKKDYTKAREMIASNPQLASDLKGKEALARIAFLEGNKEVANQLYWRSKRILRKLALILQKRLSKRRIGKELGS